MKREDAVEKAAEKQKQEYFYADFQCAVDKTSRLQGNKTNKNRITGVTSKTIDSRVSSSYTKKKQNLI